MYDDVTIRGKITTAREYTSEKGPNDRRLLLVRTEEVIALFRSNNFEIIRILVVGLGVHNLDDTE